MKLLDKAYIGRASAPTTITVEPAQLRFFLKAIGEERPIYHDAAAAKAAGYRAIPIPPTYLFCLQVLSATNSYSFYQEAGIDVGRLLHGEQGFAYHQPICVGDVLTFTAEIVDIVEKKNGQMTLMTQNTRVENAAGEHVADVKGITVIRNVGAAA